MWQNIKICRAAVTRKDINNYFDNSTITLGCVPANNIINYDVTILSDDLDRI